MVTQILVISLIRSAGPLWRARPPRPVLLAPSLGALAVAVFLAMGPLSGLLGFAAVPGSVLGALALLACLYLPAAEGMKRFAFPKRT